MVRLFRFAATALTLTLAGTVVSSASAQIRGEGTMLVRQSTDCSGTGTASTVYFPFSALFTGFEPGETGEVTAFTQPGGVQVGHRAVTVDEQGNRCELVEGTVPPGQYKLVYDFESGTGKQKVIRVVAPPGGSTSPSASVAPSASASVSVTPTPSPSGAPTPAPSPSVSTPPPGTPPSSEVGKITFTPLRDYVADRAALPRTGADLTVVLAVGVALLVSGSDSGRS